MIQANELRIGNWIMLLGVDYQHDNKFPDPEGDEPIQVTADMLKEVERSEADYGPIPLTPELLEKAGFDVSFWGYTKSGFPFSIWHYEGKEEMLVQYNRTEEEICYISFLHELQNLYFALTGKELEVSL